MHRMDNRLNAMRQMHKARLGPCPVLLNLSRAFAVPESTVVTQRAELAAPVPSADVRGMLLASE